MSRNTGEQGFGLLELAIVLVVIGLIVGGIVVGQDLIAAATVRAQIAQIDKYQSAATTFESKYGYLPGDIPLPAAATFGLVARGTYSGQGDGNGVIEGLQANWPGTNFGALEAGGETVAFWVDLSTAGLMDGSFTVGSPLGPLGGTLSGSTLNQYFPAAKINGNFVYVDSINKLNYFSVSGIDHVSASGNVNNGLPTTIYGIPVYTAYSIDKKIDDGLPQTGAVTAQSAGPSAVMLWAGTSDTSATAGSSTTCYDNNNTGGATQNYSIKQAKGAGINCSLSFQIQN